MRVTANLYSQNLVAQLQKLESRQATLQNQISTGQQVTSMSLNIDYNLNQRFNIRFYFDKVINSPYVSNQYRTSNTKGGITLRFTLAQ